MGLFSGIAGTGVVPTERTGATVGIGSDGTLTPPSAGSFGLGIGTGTGGVAPTGVVGKLGTVGIFGTFVPPSAGIFGLWIGSDGTGTLQLMTTPSLPD